MQWTRRDDGWRWRFALIPFCLRDGPTKTWVWLEWYRARFAGLYTEVELLRSENGDASD
jgi:hypothetical protein